MISIKIGGNMKKILIIVLILFIVSGCKDNKVEKKEVKEEKKVETVEKKDTYNDLNNTDIGLYIEKGNKLELVTEYKTNIKSVTDIGVFQIYPSSEQEIILNSKFGNSFYEKWTSLDNYQNLKIGFNLKYTLDSGEEVTHTILDPSTTMKTGYEFIVAYLYDDYKNRNSNFYSHIEQSDYNAESLFTSIKLFSNNTDRVVSKIKFMVFTYDSPDDIIDLEYRGNSKYEITICDINSTC